MEEINISEFKARCLALIEEVDRGGEGLLILKRGRPVAMVVPPPRDQYPQFTLRGSATIHGDLTEPVFDEWGES